ncbi:hypothetical protein R1sor_020180 [Riccia sorocarpa]|uniref:Uncharacterized protein n=1 Tax=Riccia sorocarpa TaxID=122646 RepID=A0ABD3IEK6_9MARC
MFRSRFVHLSSLSNCSFFEGFDLGSFIYHRFLIVHSSRVVPAFELKGSSLTFATKYAAVKHKNLRGKDWKERKRASRINSSAVVGLGVGCVGGIVGVGNVGIVVPGFVGIASPLERSELDLSEGVVPGFVGIASPLERSELDLSEGDDNLSDSKE